MYEREEQFNGSEENKTAMYFRLQEEFERLVLQGIVVRFTVTDTTLCRGEFFEPGAMQSIGTERIASSVNFND